MLRVPKHGTTAEMRSSPPSTNLVIETMQVQGPARARLRKRFRRDMASLAAVALPLGGGVLLGVASDSGPRPRNEDSAVVLLARLGNGRDTVSVILAAVADGMGGHADGDLASAITIQRVTEAIVDEMLGDEQAGGVPRHDASRRIEDVLEEAVAAAHRTVKAKTEKGGTTLTCAVIVEGAATIAHVGDSRAYLFESGKDGVELLTRDHSMVRRLQDAGLVKEEDIPHHPMRSVLYRAIGHEDAPKVDIVYRDLEAGSRLLLCSDGVWEAMSEADLRQIVLEADHPQHTCEKLIDAALAGGAQDNVTAVLVQIPSESVMLQPLHAEEAEVGLGNVA